MSNAIPKPPVPSRPRRSSFAQVPQNPAASAPDHDESQAGHSSPGGAATQLSTPAPAPEPAPASSGKRLGGNSKDILFSLPEEEKDRMINTIAWTTPRTGIRHQSKFIRYAIAKACEDLEREFNSGEPFPAPVDSSL